MRAAAPLRRFFARSVGDQVLLLLAGGATVIGAILVRVLPFRWTCRLLAAQRRVPNCIPRDATAIGAAVTTASRLIPGATCLAQTVAASLLLRFAGLEAEAHIGVTTAGGELLFHAWLERDGQAIVGGIETAPQSFFREDET